MGLAIFIVLMMTQITFLMSNQFSLGSVSAVSLLVLLSVFGYSFLLIKQVAKRNVWGRMSCESKRLLTMVSILTLGYLFLLLLRTLTGDNRISITVTSIMAVGILIFVICDLINISIKSVLCGCSAFLCCAHIYLMAIVINGGSVRASMLLTNINVYNAVVIFIYPLLIYYFVLYHKKDCILRRLVVLANILAIPIVALFSGSRFSIWCILGGALLCIAYLLRKKILKTDVIRWLLSSLAVGVFITIGISIISPSLRNDAGRALFLMPSGYEPSATKSDDTQTLSVKGAVIKTDKIQTETSDDKMLSTKTSATQADIGQNGKNEEKTPSSNIKMITRPWLYRESLIAIKSNFLIGTGSSLVYIEGWGMHPSHNFFLEVFLTYGVILGFLYIAILFLPLIHFSKNAKRSPYSWISLLSFCSLFLFAMFEPVLTDQILVATVVWLVFGAINNTIYEIDNGVVE